MDLSLPTYCLFAAQAETPSDGRGNRYRVEDVCSVTGEAPVSLDGLTALTRIESNFVLAPVEPWCFRGVTQHHQYTSAEQRKALAHAHAEFAPGDVRAMLIPIRKSAAWWSLPTDQRQAFFNQGKLAGHTAIGEKYVDRVFRKLYHSRYLDTSLGYDFLTYFEFRPEHEPAFRDLLAALRDPSVNPEWAYVDLEYEIHMTKIA